MQELPNSEAPEKPAPEPDLAKREATVFRVRRANPLAALFLGILLGWMFAGVLGMLLPEPAASWLQTLVIALGLAAGIGLSLRLERRSRHDSCSDPECQVELPAEAETCPRCGGRIVRR